MPLGAVGRLFSVEDHGPVEVLGFFLHHPQTVVAADEHVRGDLFTDSVTGAQVLVDPDHELGLFGHVTKLGDSGACVRIHDMEVRRPDSARCRVRRSESPIGWRSPRSESTLSPRPRETISGSTSTRCEAAAGPFGGTIAHGFLTLALTVPLAGQVELDVGEPKMAINYGLEKVRFPAPAPVGGRIRARVTLLAVSEVPGGIQVNRQVTMEVEGGEKPAMVAETVSRYYY